MIPDKDATSKYGSLPTTRLLALSRSSLDDLLQLSWCDGNGRNALEALIGLARLHVDPVTQSESIVQDADKGVEYVPERHVGFLHKT